MHGSLKITRRRGGQVLSFVTGLIASVGASANPQGAQVVSGSAVFANPTPQTLEVTNSPAAILNWQSFNIGKGETTRFIQQNAASAVLNRVVAGNSSEILGKLVSNGHVFLINPAGILIGRDGSVDTAGVVLSSLQITDQDFINGRLHFEGDANSGAVTNHGYIKTAPGGEVVLIAPRIENSPEAGNTKSGLIESPNGDLILAAGSSITIASLDDPDITFDVRAPDNEVVNLGQLLARGGTVSVLAGTIRHSGEINADTVSSDGAGHISLKASSRIALGDGSTIHAAGSKTLDAGTIDIDARSDDGKGQLDALGSVRADGATGGKINVQGDDLLVDGTISAGGVNKGGVVNIQTTDATIATVNARIQTASTEGRGGQISIDGGKSAFTSAVIRATGTRGGSVKVLGDEVTLASARIRVDGVQGGGKVRIGGGFRGGEGLHAAQKVQVNDTSVIAAGALERGDGGDVVVWSDGTTQYAGTISARGGPQAGDGGRIEVSGRAGVGYTGRVDVTALAGDVGSLLLDPKNIRFTSQQLPAAPIRLLDPHPGADNFFGSTIEYYDASGNRTSNPATASTVVVYDPLDDFGGANAGAVYVYRLSDGALLSGLHGLTGSGAGDQVGNQTLSNFTGLHVLRSQLWGGGIGALTSFDPVNGTSGAVDATTSLVGAAVGDNIGGSGIRFLGGTTFAVLSPSFNSGSGAVTLVSANNFSGTVSSTRSLVGANPGDGLGNSIFDLGSGNWAVQSLNGGAGSLTVLHAGTPSVGTISSANSLVGSAGDAIGDGGLFLLGTSNTWVMTSTQWSGGKGAVTWIVNSSTPTGVVGPSNSLVGSAVGDLGNGNALFSEASGNTYLLFSANSGAGAVTLVSPSVLPVGLIDGTPGTGNSIVGSLSTDQIGHNVNGASGNFDVINNIAAIYSPHWNNDKGAVTWINLGASFAPGPVDGSPVTGNSLVGLSGGDQLGLNFVQTTGFGFDVLRSNNAGMGAVPVIYESAPPIGPIDGTLGTGNSLVGTVSGDNVGSGGVNLIGASTFVIMSPAWTAPGGKANAGAVTLFDASTGKFNGTGTPLSGQVGASNSLVGSNTGDQVGSAGVEFAYQDSTDSVFVVRSPNWANTPSVPGAGAMTWFTLSSALSGAVSTSNSLVGASTSDSIGSGNSSVSGLGFSSSGIYQLFGSSTQSALFYSQSYGNNAGAVVYLDGSGPPVGAISAGNALIGGAANDQIGSNGIFEISGGRYLVASPNWDNFTSVNAGAVTIASSNSGVSGFVSSANSLVGDLGGDQVGSEQFDSLDSGNILIRSPNWHANTGAVTYVDLNAGHLIGGSDFSGVVNAGNSLIGTQIGDNIGASGSLHEVAFGKYVLLSPDLSGPVGVGPVHAGAVTYFSDPGGVAGLITSGNSLVGSHNNDRVGSDGLFTLDSGNVLILSSQWNSNAGAVTFLDVNTGQYGGNVSGVTSGTLDQTNSLVGRTAGDAVGSAGIQEFFTGNSYYAVFSPLVDNTSTGGIDAGAVTLGDEQHGVHGFADSNTVSLVGTSTNDNIGANGNTDSAGNGNQFLINPQWNGNMGAVTFLDLVNGTGLTGDISVSNSLIGSTSGDLVGIGGVQGLTNGAVAIFSPHFSNGGSTTDAGAISWGSDTTGLSGVLSTGNSLVGANASDGVGSSFLNFVSGTSSLWVARTAGFNGGKSALTFADTSGSLPTGLMGAANSLLGSTVGDNVGAGFSDVFTVAAGGNVRVVVLSRGWDNGSTVDAGAITTFLSSAPKTGTINNTNSLVGTNTSDFIANGSFVALNNGNRLIVNSNWNGTRGAVTFWNVSTDLVGDLGAGNSLIGAAAGDFVGSGFAQQIFATNTYMVKSPNFNASTGALSFGSITSGVKGVIGASNSLVGASPGEQFGSSLFSGSFSNGHAFVQSSNGGKGAVTFIDANNAPRGVISAANSLVGSTAGDGTGQATRFISGNVIAVLSPGWDNGAAVDAGAVTLLDLTTGKVSGTTTPFVGRISANNSLVGSFAGDQVGSTARSQAIQTLFDGTSVSAAVISSNWNGGRGAVTWLTIGQPLLGPVSASNSLVGSFAGDQIGTSFGSAVEFFNTGSPASAFGVVYSPSWNGGRGAMTWIKPDQFPVGPVTADNSLVGAFTGDNIGEDFDESFSHGMMPLFNGNFVLLSPAYNSNGGAVTFLNPLRGLPVGTINSGNSLVGAPGDNIGESVDRLGGDRVLISSEQATVNGLAHAGRLDILDGSKTQSIDTLGLGGSPSDDLAVSIPAVIDFLNNGGTLNLLASNDIFIPAGSSLVAKGGSLTLAAGRSIEVKGNIFTAGFLRLFANAPGGDPTQRDAGQGFVSVLADSKPVSVIANQLEVDAEDVVVQGGNAKGAFALLYGVESASILAHGSGTVTLRAGSGVAIDPAPSLEILSSLLPGSVANGSPITIDAPVALLMGGKALDVNSAQLIEMYGGASQGAFASIASFGSLKVQSPSITMQVGTASNTDAVFLGMGGAADVTFSTCTGCGDLLADPLLDAGSQTGTFLAGLFTEPTLGAVLSNLPEDWIHPTTSKKDPETEEEKAKKKKEAEAHCN